MVILPRQGRWRTMGQSYGRATILVALLLCLTHAQEYNYAQLIDASFFFYEAQASGVLPSWNRASRANGGWRDASFVDDGKDIGKNLSGGWFDAGDYVKFQLPYGWSVSVLAWSVLEFPAAFSGANAQLYGVAKRNLQWAADFIVKSHVTASDNPADNVYVAQVGDTDADHGKWGRAEQWYASGSTYRPTWLVDRNRPGSDIVGNAVASLAGVAMVLRMEDPASSQANALLARARQLYAFAKAYPGAWGIPSGNYPYGTGSRQWQDEMLWAAVWMCRAGQGASFCTDAVNGWSTASGMGFATAAGMDWDNVFNAASVMMLGMPDKFPAATLADVRRRMDANLNKWHVSTKCTQPPPGTDWNGDGVVDDWTICYSGKGLAHLAQWGTLRSTANAAALKLVYSKYIADAPAEVARQRCWARGQLRLMLGDWGRSFVVGMGTNPPQRPHHRSSSCDLDYAVPCDYGVLRLTRANPAVLRGALVGGPNKRDEYLDDRADYVLNEVALDYNAGYTVALAGLLALGATTPNWNAYCGTPASPSASPKPSLSPSPSPKPSPSPSPSPKPSPSPSPSPKPSPSPSPSPKPSPSPSPKPSPSPSPKPSPSPSSSPKPSPTPSPSPKPSPSPSPSPKPSPTASPSPSPSASPSPTNGICPAARWECTGCESTTQPGTPLAAQRTPCYNCVNARGAPNSWQCHACVSNTSYTAVQASSCLACVIGGGDSWACKAYCTDLSTDANLLPSCTGCTADAGIRTTAQQWRCGLCMAPAVLANGLDAAKGCFSCVRSGREPNVCVECSKKLNSAARSTCLSCVAANPGSPWGCV